MCIVELWLFEALLTLPRKRTGTSKLSKLVFACRNKSFDQQLRR